jgi:ATP/maltotriose-dependent transcriptional regulator MalT
VDDPRPGPSRIVGRGPELARLSEVLDEVANGRGRVVLVHGETGIGKSRLLEEVAERAAARGLPVLWGRAVEGGGAYRPIAEALAGLTRAGLPVRTEALGPYAGALTRLLPDWSGIDRAASLDADPAVVLGEAVVRLLAEVGGGGGCLLLLEDLHWADGDTLDVLVYLITAVSGLPVAVVASARDDASTTALRTLESSPQVLRLGLGRLDPDDVLALAATLDGPLVDERAARLLVERSEGLPLLVEELLPAVTSAGRDPAGLVPPSFAALVRDRLDALAAEERAVVAAAAVLGSVEPELLAAITGATEDQVLAALRAGTGARLLTTDGATLSWRHALTRDAVSATLLPPEHAALARRAASALLARGGHDDEAAAVELLRQAGSSHEAVDLMLDLAERNQARGALRTAEELLAHVEETRLRPERAAVARVRLLTEAGRPADALAAGADVLDAVTGDEHGELALQLARAAIRTARWSEAASYVDRAALPDDPRSESLLADADHARGNLVAAARHADRAVRLATELDRPEPLCEALVIRAKVNRIDDLAAATEDFRMAHQVATRHGLLAWQVEALSGLGSLEVLTDETTASLTAARELAVSAGLLGHAAAADVLLLDHQLLAAGPTAAEPAARELLTLGQTLGLTYTLGAARHVLASAAALRGARDDRHVHPDDPAPETREFTDAIRAFEAVLGHDVTGAAELMDQFVGPLLGYAAAAPLHQFGLWALLRTVADRDGEAARTTLSGIPAGRRLVNRGLLSYAEAVAAGRAGDAGQATVHLEQGEQALAGVPWLRALARVLTLECAVADGWGDPVPLLRLTLSEHEQLDQEGLARTCRDLLRRAGAPTRRGRGSSSVPDGLRRLGVTSREMDVLLQVAEGASNATIAERLFLSPRTVETHVASLLRKTGAADRQQLATYVDEHR